MKWASKQSGFTIVELLIVIVVIAILAAIVIVSYNGITNQAKESAMVAELANWKHKSEVYKVEHGIECPANYVFVYANPNIPGSTDFCIMKYEAKIQGQANGIQAYNASFVAESRPDGIPWVNISQVDAIAEAEALGSGYHIPTEVEWMTLAADVLSVKYNWSGGEVGAGHIAIGHSDGTPSSPIAASPDDTNGYFNTSDSANTADIQRRTLYLKSGDVIWDVAGNAWEWTQDTDTMVHTGVSTNSGFAWVQWNAPGLTLDDLPAVSRPENLTSVAGLSDITSWNSSHGIGQIYSKYNDGVVRALRRGGGYGSGAVAGVLSLSLNYAPVDTGSNGGFRVAR